MPGTLGQTAPCSTTLCCVACVVHLPLYRTRCAGTMDVVLCSQKQSRAAVSLTSAVGLAGTVLSSVNWLDQRASSLEWT